MNIRDTKYRVWPGLLSLPLGIIAAVMARYAVLLPWIFEDFVCGHPRLRGPFIEAGLPGLVHSISIAAAAGAALVLVASLSALFPKSWSLRLLRSGYMAVWLICAFYAHAVFRAQRSVRRIPRN
ncbi:MAG: hypothetical protein WCL16_05675, partial [bacterium]